MNMVLLSDAIRNAIFQISCYVFYNGEEIKPHNNDQDNMYQREKAHVNKQERANPHAGQWPQCLSGMSESLAWKENLGLPKGWVGLKLCA